MKIRILLIIFVGLGLAPEALAQDQGFHLNRYDPAVRGSDWFVSESLDFRGHLRPAAGVTLDWGHKPLVLYDAQGNEVSALVRNQLFGHLGGALILWDRLRVGASVPVALYQDGDSGETVLPSASGAAFGDVRLEADARILGSYGSLLTLAAGVQIFLPTGSPQNFTSDGTTRIVPRIMAAGRLAWVEYAAQFAVNVRLVDRAFAGTPLGSEAFVSLAAGARILDDALLLGPELYFATGLREMSAFFNRTTTPVELLGSARYTFLDDFRVGLAAGPGLSRGLGAPTVRVLAAVEWIPSLKPAGSPKEEAKPDRDSDGIPDSQDACPDDPGIATDDEETHGCPEARLDTSDRRIHIAEQIRFETGSAKILRQSHRTLNAVIEAIKTDPSIKKVRIEGHTDNRGGKAYNLDLSNRRAASVRQWLIDHGIDADLLESIGHGEEKPIASNATERGRQRNRRVEFHIVE